MLFNTCIIRNINTSDEIVLGVTLAQNETYTIPDEKRISAGNDSTIIDRISSGDLQVGNGVDYYTDTADQVNRLKNIDLREVDDEGRQIDRIAYGKKGWTYFAHPTEFTTAKLSSLFSEDYEGNDRADYLLKFYDVNGDEITSGVQTDLDNDCVETRLTLKPGYDYEIISGTVDIHTAVTENVRLYVVGGIIDSTTSKPWEYPAGTAHVKEFAGGINFKYIGVNQKLETDGRASKFMCKDKDGIPYAANQFQFIFKHPAGSQHDFMAILEYFRA